MKLRHQIAIFSFLAAFGLSVFFVGLSLPKGCTAETSLSKNPPSITTAETELQARIRQFMEADRQTGYELSDDKLRFSQSDNYLNAEKLATARLIEKMQKVKCDNLPEDFCKAWGEHVVAWQYKAFTFRVHTGKSMGFFNADEQISVTYRKMQAAARSYGVDFKY
jgi:hypothetical protein